MPTQITHVNLQYSHTIGHGEPFGPGFAQPVFMARGEDNLMYVLCRASEYRPEGTPSSWPRPSCRGTAPSSPAFRPEKRIGCVL
jgi:hypothetical protein